MKVDTQIADGLSLICKDIFAQSFSCKNILSNQKHTANTVRNTRRTTICWMRGKIKEFLFIKLTLYLSLSFRNLSYQGKLWGQKYPFSQNRNVLAHHFNRSNLHLNRVGAKFLGATFVDIYDELTCLPLAKNSDNKTGNGFSAGPLPST